MEDAATPNWITAWNDGLTLAYCEWCQGNFILPAAQLSLACPYCGQFDLQPLDPTANTPVYTHPPELLLPPTVPETRRQEQVSRFARQVWFPPTDLTAERLLARLRPIYLPMWLVDVQVEGLWQAEIGTNYQVVSHKEQFGGNQWRTQQVQETRIRWEPRLGMLSRPYQNQPAPALEEFARLEQVLGRYRLEAVRPFQSSDIAQVIVHLPNRSPQDAWPEAETGLKQSAMAECQQATAADHIREFRWSPQFSQHNWTQLLLPLYTTFYQDDEGRARIVYMQGQTGNLVGERRASARKGWQWTQRLGLVALALFGVGLVLTLVGYAGVTIGVGFTSMAVLLLMLGAVMGGTAVLPVIIVWYLNTYSYPAHSATKQLFSHPTRSEPDTQTK